MAPTIALLMALLMAPNQAPTQTPGNFNPSVRLDTTQVIQMIPDYGIQFYTHTPLNCDEGY